MPSITSLSRFFVLIICCQWMTFCSAKDGGVIVLTPPSPFAPATSSYTLPRTASSHVLRSCSAEFSSEPLLRRSLSEHLGDERKKASTMQRGGSFPEGMYLLTEQSAASGVRLVAMSVFGGSGDFAAKEAVVLEPSDDSAALPPTLVGLQRNKSPVSSPVTHTARRLAGVAADLSRDLATSDLHPSDLLRLVLCIGPDSAPFIKEFIGLFSSETGRIAGQIGAMKSSIENCCNEVVRTKFKWGSIPLNEITTDGYERLSLARLLRNYIETPELALRRCLKTPEADLKEVKGALVSAIEAGEVAAQTALDSIFVRRNLPNYKKDVMENIAIAQTLIGYIDTPQLALRLYLKPEVDLMGFKTELEEAITSSERKLVEIDTLREQLRLLGAFGPVPASPKAGIGGEGW